MQQQEAEAKRVEMVNEYKELQARYEELLKQEELDNDDEHRQQVIAHRAAIAHEREAAQTLKGEGAILRKKFEAFQTEMERMESQLAGRNTEIRNLKHEAGEAQQREELLRKDIREREDSINDKERRMTELKAKNKELEKFKFVLDYKLRELKKEIEPRDEQIVQMRETIRELDDELQRDYRSNVTLEQSLLDMQAKIDSLHVECKKRGQQVQEKERLLSFFGRDLHRLVTSTAEPAQWREGVKAMYRSYVKQMDLELEATQDSEEVAAEFGQQRAYMERALDALKSRVGRTEEQMKYDFRKKIDENQALIQEINELRAENKDFKAKIAKYEADMAAPAPRPKSKTAVSADNLLRSAPSLLPGRGGSITTAFGSRPSTGSSAGRGQLVRGSASLTGKERARMGEMALQIEASGRESDAQKLEISHLREQVASLMSQRGAHGCTASASRPQLAQVEQDGGGGSSGESSQPVLHTPRTKQLAAAACSTQPLSAPAARPATCTGALARSASSNVR